MKKRIVSIVLVLCILSLCACKKSSDTDSTEIETSNSAAVTTKATENEAASESTKATKATETPVTTAPQETQKNQVTVSYETIEQSEPAEPTIDLITATFTYPVITIDGNKAATDAIAASVQALRDSDQTSYDEALASSEEMYSAGNYNGTYELSTNSQMVVLTDTVICIRIDQYCFLGGAHGGSNAYGMTFDLATGKQITFADIFTSEADFDAVASTDIVAQINAMTEEDRSIFFEDYATSVPSCFPTAGFLYNGDTFIIIFPEYAIACYAAGMSEFSLPVSEYSSQMNAYGVQLFS